MSLPSLVPVAYSAGNGVTIYRARRSPDLWAVRRGDMWLGSQECLSIDGEWVYEPMPSSRTQAWLDKHRFATAESAAACYFTTSAPKRGGAAMTSLCFQVRPRDGEDYVGYVFAESRGKARALAAQTDPAGCFPLEFTDWSVHRRPSMDGKAQTGAAWWSPEGVPQDAGIAPADLWTDE